MIFHLVKTDAKNVGFFLLTIFLLTARGQAQRDSVSICRFFPDAGSIPT